MSEDEKKCSLSCSECAVRNCYRREKQYPAFCLTEEYKDAVELTRRLYESDGIDGVSPGPPPKSKANITVV